MRVIIFDYDDTLFPSTHIARNNLYDAHVNSTAFMHHRECVQDLEAAAITMLAEAIALGDLIVIVTNGKLDWIKYSMKMYYQRFFEFVRQHDTPIVSAQDIFSPHSPHPMMWKITCFQQLLASLKSTNNSPSQLISVGDGAHEAIACEVAAQGIDIPYRNVILLDTPSPRQMTTQLSLLAQELHGVITHHAFKVDFNAAVVSGGNIEFRPVLKDVAPVETPVPFQATIDVGAGAGCHHDPSVACTPPQTVV